MTSGTPVTGYEVLDHPNITAIAAKYGKTSANVVLRWHLKLGGALVTKSVTPSRYAVVPNHWSWDHKYSLKISNLWLKVGLLF